MWTGWYKISLFKGGFPIINHSSFPPRESQLFIGQSSQIQSDQVPLDCIYWCCFKHMWFCLEACLALCLFFLSETISWHSCVSLHLCPLFSLFHFLFFVVLLLRFVGMITNNIKSLYVCPLARVCVSHCLRAGVPDLPAEEDCCSLGASECWAGGQESVCQRGTITRWSHVNDLALHSVRQHIL